MKTVMIHTEFIKLGQLLKLAGLVDQGSDAKLLIASGEVMVNGTVAQERGKKIHPGDVVQVKNGVTVTVALKEEGGC